MNDSAYTRLVRDLHASDGASEPERVLQQISAAADFAATFHTGRFADGAIENMALDIGRTRLTESFVGRAPARNTRARHLLHVATEVGAIGGHTRMLRHWINADPDSTHSLFVVVQRGRPVPPWLATAVADSGGTLVVMSGDEPALTRAAALRETATAATMVMLHHRASDVVPVLAFARPGGPPVAVLNQSDHQFWLGSSVADATVNLRSAAAVYTRTRRQIARNLLLPIPLNDTPASVTRDEARRRLGMSNDEIVLLSVGRPEKFYPRAHYDFSRTARRILEREPRARLYVVGESMRGIAPYLREPPHERLVFVGSLDDPSLFRRAADVYLESFPFGSTTALLEAALDALPVVPAYAPLFTLLVGVDDSLNRVATNPDTEEAYIGEVERLMASRDARVDFGRSLRSAVLSDHTGDGWLEHLHRVYKGLSELTHAPRSLDVPPPLTTDVDLGLSEFRVGNGRDPFFARRGEESGRLAYHCAYIARETGDDTTARTYARRALFRGPLLRETWRLLFLCYAGALGRFIRRKRNAWQDRRKPKPDSSPMATCLARRT